MIYRFKDEFKYVIIQVMKKGMIYRFKDEFKYVIEKKG